MHREHSTSQQKLVGEYYLFPIWSPNRHHCLSPACAYRDPLGLQVPQGTRLNPPICPPITMTLTTWEIGGPDVLNSQSQQIGGCFGIYIYS